MRVRLLYAAGAVAGLGLWGAVLAGAQQPHPGHHPGGQGHHGDRPPDRRWQGMARTRVETTRYIPRTAYTAHYAQPPSTNIFGDPIKPLSTPTPPATATPGQPENPAVGPTRPTAEPAGPTVEPSLSEPTTFWSNYWEVYRRPLLRDLRGWKQPTHRVAGPVYRDPLIQVLLRGLLDRDPWVAAESAVSLGSAGRPELFPLLERVARGRGERDSHIVRSGGVLAVGLCPEPRAAAVLQEIVAEFDPEVIQEKSDKERAAREARAGNPPRPAVADRGGVDLEAMAQYEYRAAYALTGMGFAMTPEHLDYLTGLVKRSDVPLRMRVAALTAVARHEDAAAASLLISILMSPHLPHQLRGTAALGLGRTRVTELPGIVQGTRAAEVLLEVMNVTGMESRSTRLGAAAGLAECGTPADLAAMQAWLDGWTPVPHVDPAQAKPGHDGEDDITVRGALLLAMARIARAASDTQRGAVRAALVQHTGLKQHRAVRGMAALGLGILQDAAGVPALLAVLADDPDSHVQGAAAVALGLLRHEPAVGPLIKTLGKMMRDPNKQADAAYVIEGLGLLKTEEALATVRLQFRKAPDQHQRRAAALALAVAGDDSIVLELIEDLSHADQWRGPGATVALSYYAADKVRVVLMQAATAESPKVRLGAVKVLGGWLHDPVNPRIAEWAAPGVVFPSDGAHLYEDLLVWQ